MQQQMPPQVLQHHMNQQVNIQTRPPVAGNRAHSPAPLNLSHSNSRVLVGTRVVGPPVT